MPENIYESMFLNLLTSSNKCPGGDLEIGVQYFVLVSILTLEVSCIVFIIKWD